MPVSATVRGTARPLPDDMEVRWISAAPPDRRTSFSGSGLPFSSQEQAFHSAPHGVARVDPSGAYEIRLEGVPNSYHVRSSEHPVPPQVTVEWTSRGRRHLETIGVGRATEPSRSLRASCLDHRASFSDVRTQEDYLRSSGYSGPGGIPPLEFVP